MRVLILEDEPYLADAIRDGLRLAAIASDIAGDGDTALELLSINGYDIAVLDRDVPGPSGDEVARRIVASGSGMPILMLTAADRLDDKASGFERGADDYLTKPFELRELVLRLRALDRRRAHNRPPVREIAGVRLDPFRREVHRDGRYVALTRKQFAVLEVLVAADGGVVSAEELLERAWDENADPFTNAVRITVLGAAQAARRAVGDRHGARGRLPHRRTGRRGDGDERGQGAGAERPAQAHPQLRRLPHARGHLAAGDRVGVPPALRARPGGLRPRPGPLQPDPIRPPRRVRAEGSAGADRPARRRPGRRLAAGRPDARTADQDHRGHPHRRHGDLSHRIRLDGRSDEFRELADAFDTMLARLEGTGRRAAEVRGQRLPRAAHPPRDHADPPRRGPHATRTTTTASWSTASTTSTPEPSASPRHCSSSAGPTSGPSPENRSTCPCSRRTLPRRFFPRRRSAASRSRRPATPPRPSGRRRSCSS